MATRILPFSLILAFIAFILRLAIDTFGFNWDYRFFYLSLLVILAAYGGMYLQRKKSNEHFTFVMDLKAGIQGVSVFALGSSLFTFVFYRFIHPGFLSGFAAQRRNEILENAIKNDTPQEDIARMLENFDAFSNFLYSPFKWATVTLVLLLISGTVYAVIFAVIARKAKGMFSL